jgi:hypothetical protein
MDSPPSEEMDVLSSPVSVAGISSMEQPMLHKIKVLMTQNGVQFHRNIAIGFAT